MNPTYRDSSQPIPWDVFTSTLKIVRCDESVSAITSYLTRHRATKFSVERFNVEALRLIGQL